MLRKILLPILSFGFIFALTTYPNSVLALDSSNSNCYQRLTKDAPQEYLNIGGNFTSKNLYLGTCNNYKTDIITNGISRISIATNGSVGIGTSTPETLLDIEGSLKAGNQLASNSSGHYAVMFNELVADNDSLKSSSPDPRFNNWIYTMQSQLTVDPDIDEVSVEKAFFAGKFDAEIKEGNSSDILSKLVGFQGQADYKGGTGGSIKNMTGIQGSASNRNGAGLVTKASGGVFNVNITGSNSGSIQSGYALRANAWIQRELGTTGNINYLTGLNIFGMNYGLNHTDILLGTEIIPEGNYGIYQSTGDNNYFAGNIGIGVLNPSADLEVNGSVKLHQFAGQGNLILKVNNDGVLYATESLDEKDLDQYVSQEEYDQLLNEYNELNSRVTELEKLLIK